MKRAAAALILICMLFGMLAACRRDDAPGPIEIELGADAAPPMPQNEVTPEPSSAEEGITAEPTEPTAQSGEESDGTSPVEEYAAYINGNRVNFRAEPGREAEILDVFPKYSPVTVIGEGDEWLKIVSQGVTGYVAKKYVSAGEAPTPAPTAVPIADLDGISAFIDGNGVNLRSEPSTESEVLLRFSRGDTVTLTGEWGDWYRIEAGGTEGYVAKRFVVEGEMPTPAPTPIPVEKTSRTEGYVNRYGVNFREEPSTESPSIAKLSKGTPVVITGKTDEWYRVEIDEQTGFISKEFITLGKYVPATPTPSPTPKPTPTPTPKPTKTPKPTATPTPKPTKTPKPTATPTPKPTKTPKPTNTPKPTATPTPKPTSLPYFHITPGQFTDEEVILVAKLITHEARWATNKGQRAIASVVVNRVMNETTHFPNTVSGVLFQHNQFVPESTLMAITPTDKSIANARYVMQEHGPTLPQKVLFFRAKSLGHDWYDYMTYYCTIDDDCFFIAIKYY